MSNAFTFNRENATRVLTVFSWTVASAVVALAIDFVGLIELPSQYAFVLPIVNTTLYAIKEFVTKQTK